MGKMSYSMVYGTKLVIPVEIEMLSFRTSNFDKENNKIELRLNLDLLYEKRGELRYAKQLTSTWSPNTTSRESSTCLSCQAT